MSTGLPFPCWAAVLGRKSGVDVTSAGATESRLARPDFSAYSATLQTTMTVISRRVECGVCHSKDTVPYVFSGGPKRVLQFQC